MRKYTPLAQNRNPENGASDFETVDAAGKDNISIDWKLAFDYFDHRRLVTFGVIGGFLRRIHQFPLAYVIKADNTTLSRAPIGVRNPLPPMMAIVSNTRTNLATICRSVISRR